MSFQSVLSMVRRGERSMFLIIKKTGLEALYDYNRNTDEDDDEGDSYPSADELCTLVIIGSIEDVHSVLRMNYTDKPGEYAIFHLSDILSVQIPPPSVAEVKSVFVPAAKKPKKKVKKPSKESEDKLPDNNLEVVSDNISLKKD